MKNRYKEKYMQPSTLYEQAQLRYEEMLKVIKEKEQDLERAPDGAIRIAASRKYPQYYLRKEPSDKNGIYISKSEMKLIKTHLQKNYDQKVLKLLIEESKTLKALIDKHSDKIKQIQNLYSNNHDEVKSLITPVAISDEDYIKVWLGKRYEGKAISDKLPYFETNNKELVRSKSELNIANMLAKSGLPYKYECPLTLKNGSTIYPDFTVLDVKNRREIYWEHRGMMDDRNYANHAVSRVKSYAHNGYMLGRDLIITEETSTNPLGTDEIKLMIKTIQNM